MRAVREVADIPITLLLVPALHGRRSADSPGFEARMSDCLERGHELALHGYYHADPNVPSGVRDWFWRRIYTAGEGEFSALSVTAALRRLRAGQRWFAANGWPLRGFVPPAWLMGAGAWEAVRRLDAFEYLTTFGHLHLLRSGQTMRAPCLTWSCRSGARRIASRAWTPMMASLAERDEVVRVALHPTDADYPAVRRSMQRRQAQLLESRVALTKAGFIDKTRTQHRLTIRSTDAASIRSECATTAA
jgi:predicted deacetylase